LEPARDDRRAPTSMRFYGPLAADFDRSWKLGDITVTDHG
jgi:hypothetical protein